MATLFGGMVQDFRRCWRRLFLTHIVYKATAFILLSPLVAVALRSFIALSGSAVLTDQELLYFFLTPWGLLGLLAVATLWLGIEVLGLAALMAIPAAPSAQFGLVDTIGLLLQTAWPVLRVSVRLVLIVLLTIAPFAAIAAAVYFALLAEYDINYYLQQRPPAFRAAMAIGAGLLVVLAAVLLRLLTGLFFALPLVVFAKERPANAIRQSRGTAKGQRWTIVLWVLGWSLASLVLATVLTSIFFSLAQFLVPRADGSLWLLETVVGVGLLLWGGSTLALNIFSTTTFAVIYYRLFRYFADTGTITTVSASNEKAADRVLGLPLTRARLFAAGVIGLLMATAIGAIALGSIRLEDRVKIIAHRGSSRAAPENTLAAVHLAIEEGADWVEIDVQETAYGNVVVFHDSDFKRLAGVDLRLRDATLADLKELDVGSWFDASFAEERVPTLDEVLRACRHKAVVNIELKYHGHEQQLEQRVVEIVEAENMSTDVVTMSLKAEGVRKMKELRPDWPAGLLLSASAGKLGRIDADFVGVNVDFATHRSVKSAHRSGKQVLVWTVNDASTMLTMISRGVDGLITDDPALARAVLNRRAQMSLPERLLLEFSRVLGGTPKIDGL